jgi:hypothetical protein
VLDLWKAARNGRDLRQPREPDDHRENREGCHTATMARFLAAL